MYFACCCSYCVCRGRDHSAIDRGVDFNVNVVFRKTAIGYDAANHNHFEKYRA